MLHSRLGDSQGRSENWKSMDSAGEKDVYKRTGTSCINTSPENLFESTVNRVQMNNIVTLTYFLKIGGWWQKFTNGFSFQKNLELFDDFLFF